MSTVTTSPNRSRETPTTEEIQNFTMPDVEVGSPVKWWRTGRQNIGRPEVGFVVGAFSRTIRVRLVAGTVHETVRHVSDPKLRLNPDQREGGAWDYTDEYVRNQERLAALEAQVAELTAIWGAKLPTAGNLEAPAADKPASPYEDMAYPELRNLVSQRKIDAQGNPKKDELIALLVEHDKQNGKQSASPSSNIFS